MKYSVKSSITEKKVNVNFQNQENLKTLKKKIVIKRVLPSLDKSYLDLNNAIIYNDS